jgi:CRISPR system Cascade subunit CasE
MKQKQLHLLHLRPDPRLLATWAARHHVIQAQGDLGYALHALLHAAMGDQAPQPFRYLDVEQGLLAYTHLGPQEMQHIAAMADPEVAAALGLGATAQHGGYSLRPFPSAWPDGHVLGFEVRVRPIVREGKTQRKAGKEVDAFLSAVEKSNGAALDRGEVYAQWLRDQLAPNETGEPCAWRGGAQVLHAQLDRFRLLNVMRKTQRDQPDDKRKRQVVSGPDAVLRGQLRVLNSEAFSHLLARGVGRHRAFGFGLLLLRPAG